MKTTRLEAFSDGGIAINEWLVNQGYLVLQDKPQGVVPLEKVQVDWPKTRAWGSGGYYSRIFLNVQGREPNGVIPQADYEKVRDELIAKTFDQLSVLGVAGFQAFFQGCLGSAQLFRLLLGRMVAFQGPNERGYLFLPG